MNEDNESGVTLTMWNTYICSDRQRENCIAIIAMNNDRSNIKIIRDNFQAMKQQQSTTSNYSYSFRSIVRP